MEGSQFSDSQESCIQAAKYSHMSSAHTIRLRLLLHRNRVFSLLILKILVIPSCKGEISYFSGVTFPGHETFLYEQCHPVKGQICRCSRIAFSGCENLTYGLCCPAMSLICWSSGIAYSGSDTFGNEQYCPKRGLICWCSGIAYSVAKRSHMGIAYTKKIWFSDSQESCFEAANPSNIGNTLV